MEIDYYDEDFCKDNLDEVTDLDKLDNMRVDLQEEIWKQEDKLVGLRTNMGIVQSKIDEVEND